MKLYNKFNFGIGIGAGYYFTQNFGVTARFTAGITGIFKNDYGSKVKNNAFSLEWLIALNRDIYYFQNGCLDF